MKKKDNSSYPSGVYDTIFLDSLSSEYGGDTATVFDSGSAAVDISEQPIDIGGHTYHFVTWGADNEMPFKIADALGRNMITSQCQAFNVLACYGQGLRFVDRKTKQDTDDSDILDFCLRNSLHEVFMEQATDMKYWFWTVTLLTLSRDGQRIVQVRNLDAMHCRLEYAPSTRSGRIEHVFYGDWRTGHMDPSRITAFPLLSSADPLGDLEVRMGRQPDPATGVRRMPVKERQFAIVCRMATPGLQYYPRPYYMSIFQDAWVDIYRLIGIGKRYLIKNTSAPRIQIEVHKDYWDAVCNNENIFDPDERAKRMKKEKENIIEFATGLKNTGKALVSTYYIDPNGKENRMVRVSNLTDAGKKEGGDWSDDMSEASNALCFAFGVHPNLVGATPGKSQMNNSGSDKRELFTLKQAQEKACHDVMAKPYHVILHYNGWADRATIDIPMIQLTTLDEHRDSKKVSNSNSDNGNGTEDY